MYLFFSDDYVFRFFLLILFFFSLLEIFILFKIID